MAGASVSIACKVCAAPARLFGTCDFNSHCDRTNRSHLLPPSGIDVAYYRCDDCGFLFTPFMDGFSRADYLERVYNADYRLVDPDFALTRPAHTAAHLLERLGDLPLSICDYGGGDGSMARMVNAAGRKLCATSWDPFHDDGPKPGGTFDMVVSTEVFEHAPDPAGTLAEMLALTDANRLILLSTLCQPADVASRGTGWWYCAPRNGHISLHSLESLDRLADDAGIGVVHLDFGRHLFHDVLPAWLQAYIAGHESAAP